MKYVIKVNTENNKFIEIKKEGLSLKDSFDYFNSLNVEELENNQEYELAKYDDENQILDWTNEELESIKWPSNTWVTKSK